MGNSFISVPARLLSVRVADVPAKSMVWFRIDNHMLTKRSLENGAMTWMSVAVAQFGRVGFLGKASLSTYGVKPVG